MLSIKEIREFAEYQVNHRHGNRINQQITDQAFFEDTYEIPFVDKKYQIKTGFIAEMANGITQQMATSQPRIYVGERKETKDVRDSAGNVAKVVNKWAKSLARQSMNPFQQTFKTTAFTRGEAWVYTPHKQELALWNGTERWQTANPDEIPVHFILYDPLVVFADPNEFVDGRPTRVVVSYKRLASNIRAHYPFWESDAKDNELVNFLLFTDKDQVYAETGSMVSPRGKEQPLFRDKEGKFVNGNGQRSNIYGGVVPFAHCYSGYGQNMVVSGDADRTPELLTYTRTRMIRDKVVLDASMEGAFRWNIIEFAWKSRTLLNQSGVEIAPDAYKEYRPNSPGKLNILTLPPGASVKVEETTLFDAPVFAYRAQQKADLQNAYPGSLQGIAQGTSGRQEDILSGAGLSFYDSPIEGNAILWATAFDNALKECAALTDGGVDMLPPSLSRKDIDSYISIDVKVKADDPLQTLRDKADGDRKYQLGIIDDYTNLTRFQGYTQEEAETIMTNKLIDSVTRNDPTFRRIMGMAFAKEMGVLDEFAQLNQTQDGTNPVPQFGSEGGQPREGNIKTELGKEMIDMSVERRPARMPAGI